MPMMGEHFSTALDRSRSGRAEVRPCARRRLRGAPRVESPAREGAAGKELDRPLRCLHPHGRRAVPTADHDCTRSTYSTLVIAGAATHPHERPRVAALFT